MVVACTTDGGLAGHICRPSDDQRKRHPRTHCIELGGLRRISDAWALAVPPPSPAPRRVLRQFFPPVTGLSAFHHGQRRQRNVPAQQRSTGTMRTGSSCFFPFLLVAFLFQLPSPVCLSAVACIPVDRRPPSTAPPLASATWASHGMRSGMQWGQPHRRRRRRRCWPQQRDSMEGERSRALTGRPNRHTGTRGQTKAAVGLAPSSLDQISRRCSYDSARRIWQTIWAISVRADSIRHPPAVPDWLPK